MRTIVITGGSRGLGAELSRAACADGDTVVAIHRTPSDASRRLASEIAAAGGRLHLLPHDITASEIPDALPLEGDRLVVIHNATAPFEPRPWHLWDGEAVRAQCEVAVTGFFHTVRPLLRPLSRAREATVVSVLSSVLADPIPAGFGGYVAAKAALEGATRALAAEVGKRGIRVFSVAPGFLETPLTAPWNPAFRAEGSADRSTDPAVAARAILDRIDDPTIPARGEVHSLTEKHDARVPS